MTRMVRKQVYISPAHDAALKQRARHRAVTEAELIRRGIEQATNAELSDDEKHRPLPSLTPTLHPRD